MDTTFQSPDVPTALRGVPTTRGPSASHDAGPPVLNLDRGSAQCEPTHTPTCATVTLTLPRSPRTSRNASIAHTRSESATQSAVPLLRPYPSSTLPDRYPWWHRLDGLSPRPIITHNLHQHRVPISSSPSSDLQLPRALRSLSPSVGSKLCVSRACIALWCALCNAARLPTLSTLCERLAAGI